LSSVLAYLKLIYEHKEKIILGLLIIAFAVVGYQQYKLKKDMNMGKEGDNPGEITYDFAKKPRPPQTFKIPPVDNPYPLKTYKSLISKNIFSKPQKEKKEEEQKKVEWADIKVKSIFDPTQSGSYIAIIEVDKRSRIVKEGQQFDDYEVQRIDGIKSCLRIRLRALGEEKEFCKEE